MSDKLRVFSYSTLDEGLYRYEMTEKEIQLNAERFMLDIWFFMSDEEAEEFDKNDEVITDNLKNDYIWFRPGINRRAIIQCTCGGFLESDEPTEQGHARLAKAAVRHSRRSGHTLNPRGN